MTFLRFQLLRPLDQMDRVEEIWAKMLVKCRHSFFTSWGWISTWLLSLPKEYDIQLVVGYYDAEPMVAFFAGRKKGLRYGFLPSRTYSLNSTGDSRFDKLVIEYNSILIDPRVSAKITDLLSPLGAWDEILFPGISSDFVASMRLLDSGGLNFFPLVDKVEKSYRVDLQAIRDAGMNYLGMLSSNKRSQIRRSLKQYELDGNVEVRAAEKCDEALAMFDELVNLHQQEWIKRDRPGAFASSYMRQFHKALIANRFDVGEIQILKIHSRERTLGYLYNFVYDQNVLFYQSGFAYAEENVYRPGLVSHYLGILHNAARGFSVYDFLAGEAHYKASLSTTSTPMYWIRLFRKKTRFQFEMWLSRMKQALFSNPQVLERAKRLKFHLEAKR